MFNQLPDEILLQILSALGPEQVAKVARVGRFARRVARDNLFWKVKYSRHFPHLYDALAKKENINWYVEFGEASKIEYHSLSDRDRRLLSLVKESDLAGLRKSKITLEDLERRDGRYGSLSGWAQRVGNQAVLNYFYEIACAGYTFRNSGYVNVHWVGKHGRNILYWALVCRQAPPIIAALLDRMDERYLSDTWPTIFQHDRKAPYVDEAIREMQFSAIHVAAKKGELEVVQAWLNQDPSLLEHRDACGRSPLYWAARNGHANVAGYLIRRGANVNVETAVEAPLYWAVKNGHSDVARQLIKAGAVTTLTVGAGRQQLIHIAARNGDTDIACALLENDPGLLEQRDADGKTPIYFAAALGRDQIVRRFIEMGAVTTAVSGDFERQPIHIAACNDNVGVVRALIENQPSLLEQKSAQGYTPLLLAAANGHKTVVEYLICQGADINAVTNHPGSKWHGHTPLARAIERMHRDTVEILLKHGATLGSAKNIHKFWMSRELRAKLKLVEYMAKRHQRPDNRTSLKLFGRTFHFGCSKQAKLDAASALNDVVFKKVDRSVLAQHKKALNNGDLGAIYRRFRGI